MLTKRRFLGFVRCMLRNHRNSASLERGTDLLLRKEGATDEDTQSRIDKASGVFNALSNPWKTNKINHLKVLRVFKGNVLFLLLYGCELNSFCPSTTPRSFFIFPIIGTIQKNINTKEYKYKV